MLDSLPPEIIEQILGHLPTASSIANVAITNKKLYAVVSANDYAIFRNFVQRSFPSIVTPPIWRDMACTLTSRSRAWDRNSFIARECYPPIDGSDDSNRSTSQKFGYIPVIDSYESWSGSTAASRKQVLAIGAGGRLRLRTTEKNRTEWKSLRMPEDHLVHNDIMDVRLLRPHQHTNRHGECIVLRRANREIVRVESGVGKDNYMETSKYTVDGAYVDCLDINMDSEPLMAVCNTKSLQLFPVSSESKIVRPSHITPFTHGFNVKHRKRCIKFLDSTTLAVSIQFVEGRERAPIFIYDVRPSGITTSPLIPSSTIVIDHPLKGRHSANTIAALDSTSSLTSRPGQVFLSGWSDGISRLHDLRTPSQPVAHFIDAVDDGQIMSLSVVGHERFFAGSHQNACLKCFDLRMPGSRVYSYLNALTSSTKLPQQAATHSNTTPKGIPQRDINIFLALTVQRNRLWAPLPRQRDDTRLPRYRGSVYSLSTPSPSSNTLFAGIENHVIQFDFVNTDDILRKRTGPCDPTAGLATLTTKPEINDVLHLSCYGRPRVGREATDPVLLRKQVEWRETVGGINSSQYGPPEDGWDHRWRLSKSWKSQGGMGSRRWSRGNVT